MAEPSFGLFTLGVNSGGGTAHFDYLESTASGGCEEPPPENQAPADPDGHGRPDDRLRAAAGAVHGRGDGSGRGRHADLRAGTSATGRRTSTQQNPTHTYTTPGEKVAKLTVSDGEATATRNVTVNVLEPDNAQARFRVLVFSKTAGFRHSSIDPGSPGDRATRCGQQLPGRPHRGRHGVPRRHPRPLRLGDLAVDDGRRAQRRPSRPPSSATSRPAAATPASTPRPTPSTTWAWYGQPRRRVLPQPPGRHAPTRDGRHVEDTDDHSTQGLPAPNWHAGGRVVQLPIARQPESAAAAPTTARGSDGPRPDHARRVDLRRGRRQHDG